ncbi:MAG: hypothetical protein AB7I33_12715 [Gemmatimonadales bacterium]
MARWTNGQIIDGDPDEGEAERAKGKGVRAEFYVDRQLKVTQLEVIDPVNGTKRIDFDQPHPNPNYRDYVEVVMCRQIIPGDPRSQPVNKVCAWPLPDAFLQRPHVLTMRYPDAWAQFIAGKAAEDSGKTRIENLPGVTPQRALQLRASSILTVEEMADIHDGLLPTIGSDAHALREKARKFVQAKKLLAQADDVKAREAEDKAKFDALMARLNALEQRNAELEATPRRGPGRPPKSRDDIPESAADAA